MKKLIIIFIISTLSALAGFAQQTNECLCVCRFKIDRNPDDMIKVKYIIDSDIYTMEDYSNFLFLNINDILYTHVTEFFEKYPEGGDSYEIVEFMDNTEKAILKEISDIEIDIIDFNYKITIPNEENYEDDF